MRFITSGFNRIFNPPDDRPCSAVIGGGAADGLAGIDGEMGIDGMGRCFCVGGWYVPCAGEARNELAAAGETEAIGDMGERTPDTESAVKLGMNIKCELMSNERTLWSHGE